MNWIIFIIFQLVTFIIFGYCFFIGSMDRIPKITTIIMWLVTIVFSGMLMMSAWNIERYSWVPVNTTIGGDSNAYESVVQTDQWQAVGGVNIGMFGLAILFGLGDIVLFARNYRDGGTNKGTLDNTGPSEGPKIGGPLLK